MTTSPISPADVAADILHDARYAEMAALLAQHPDYRVLRRMVPLTSYGTAPDDAIVARGLYVDVETTGLDVLTDQIIELALVPFTYAAETGVVLAVEQGYQSLNDPGRPIPAEVIALTGLTDADVRGRAFERSLVDQLLRSADVMIAHNAEFDRQILEREFPHLRHMPWGCSYRDVPWERAGVVGGKLQHIVADACREFYVAHRALDDVRAGLHALATARIDDAPALLHLLNAVRSPSFRVWALGAPYAAKQGLKARGYRWSSGDDGRPKAWYRDVPSDQAANGEIVWLRHFLARPAYTPEIQRVTSRDRYSNRV